MVDFAKIQPHGQIDQYSIGYRPISEVYSWKGKRVKGTKNETKDEGSGVYERRREHIPQGEFMGVRRERDNRIDMVKSEGRRGYWN